VGGEGRDLAVKADDEANLADLKDAEAALIEAHQALTRAMVGLGGAGERERFVFKLGFARGRLSRVSSRIFDPAIRGKVGSP
jgi:hypothetical protein